jgi:hypothetical protein
MYLSLPHAPMSQLLRIFATKAKFLPSQLIAGCLIQLLLSGPLFMKGFLIFVFLGNERLRERFVLWDCILHVESHDDGIL